MQRTAYAPSPKSIGLFLALALVLFVPGCYEKEVRGNESVFKFAGWLGPLLIVGGIAAIPAGWLIRRQSFRLGFVIMILAPVVLLIAAPAMYNDRVLIDDQHFEARYGFWFNPTEHNIRFMDLSKIQYVSVHRGGRRGGTKYELHCINKSGNDTVVAAGDLLRNAVPEILARAAASGVVVVNQVN